MNVTTLLISAITGERIELEENTRGHLTTREMYAVKPNRSVVKTLLSTVKDKLARR